MNWCIAKSLIKVDKAFKAQDELCLCKPQRQFCMFNDAAVQLKCHLTAKSCHIPLNMCFEHQHDLSNLWHLCQAKASPRLIIAFVVHLDKALVQ